MMQRTKDNDIALTIEFAATDYMNATNLYAINLQTLEQLRY